MQIAGSLEVRSLFLFHACMMMMQLAAVCTVQRLIDGTDYKEWSEFPLLKEATSNW